MTDEESKKKILARRARFVAAALASAGVGLAGCGGETSADPIKPGSDSGSLDAADVADTAPSVCLSPPLRDTDVDTANPDAGVDSTADAAEVEPDTGPFPCLAPPPDDGG
ncbi:MAG: hypothetical protein ABI175_24910 [Polyangiales bacterium]